LSQAARPQVRAKITALGTYVPPRLLTNADLEKMVETSDKWILERTGIRQRHIVDKGVGASDLAVAAAKVALEQRGIAPTDVEAIIIATVTPDMMFPSTACLVQDKLGAKGAWGFDVSAACSGFVYALQAGVQFIQSGAHKKVLVIGADVMSSIIDYKDRTTCIIFGDGAGAVVLTGSDVEGGVLSAVLRSNGSGGDLLGIPSVGSIDIGDIPVLVNGHKYGKMHMNGSEVFKFATRVIGESINQALDIAGLTTKDLKLIVPHQANTRIIDAVGRKLGLPPERTILTIEKHANTSAASIPLALDTAVRDGRIKKGDLLLMEGIGGGLSWGASLVRW